MGAGFGAHIVLQKYKYYLESQQVLSKKFSMSKYGLLLRSFVSEW